MDRGGVDVHSTGSMVSHYNEIHEVLRASSVDDSALSGLRGGSRFRRDSVFVGSRLGETMALCGRFRGAAAGS